MSMEPVRRDDWYYTYSQAAPQAEPQRRRERTPETVPVRRRRRKKGLNRKSKATLLRMVAVMGCIALGITMFTCITALLQYNINTLNHENTAIANEIDNVQIKIDTSCNVVQVEKNARELGMKYPKDDQLVHLEKNVPGDFASKIRETASN